MLVKRSWLILGLALFIFACEEPGEIGLDLNPENGVFVARYAEIPLGNSVILHEDVLSDVAARIDSLQNLSSVGRLLVGSFANQQFGKLNSEAFASLYLGSVGFSNDTAGFVFDSLIFNLKIDYLYGNSLLGNKRISIYELSDSIKLDSLYLTKNTTPYYDTPLGQFDFDVSRLDTVGIDTLLSTRMADELGIRFMEEAKANDTSFSNNDEFRKFFNGFAFVADETNDVVTGIIPENSATYMRMHFHNAKDTTYLDFIMQDLDTVADNNTKYYNNITLDRSGTPLEGITDYYTDFDTGDSLSYIQGASGIFTKVNIQPYLNFIDTIDHLIINRAEFEIPVEQYADNTKPSSQLDIYVIDENNRFVEQYVAGREYPVYRTVGRFIFNKDRDENKGIYTTSLTQYVQDLTSGDNLDSLLLLGQAGLWNSVTSLNQSVINKKGLTLKVYYSTLQ